jgi:hypothetical protein
MTLSEYSNEAAALIERVDSRLDERHAQFVTAPPSVEGTQAYLADRVAGYHELVDGVDALDPPEQVAELHAALQEILGTLLAAEQARASFAATVVSTDSLHQVWEGPESQAIRAAELQAITLCYAAQDQVDATEQREDFGDVPWMPAELKEVVRVSFDCPA